MPQILTTNAVITCPHGGLGTSIPSDPKWTINGGFVLLENDTGVLACPFLLYPCVGYQLRSMGLNATQLDGRKVLLVTDFNQTFTGLPLTMIETHPVHDDSTPAPLPPGAPPGLPPQLADAIKPIVVAVPPALAFNSTTMLPTALPAAFTLLSQFPMQWKLTLINEPLASDADVTNGLPPGLVLLPAGGAWNVPALTVTMTLTAPFMAALGVGMHHFFMTGVSQRGLSSFAQITLVVT